MKALSIRAPWAWAILYQGKNIENRSRRTHYRGPLVIQSSLTKDPKAVAWLRRHGFEFPDAFPTGYLVGIVDVVDCLDKVPRRLWASGPFCYVLEGPRAFSKPIKWPGRLGLFEVPDDLIRTAMSRASDKRPIA
jgi:hypothetical protein